MRKMNTKRVWGSLLLSLLLMLGLSGLVFAAPAPPEEVEGLEIVVDQGYDAGALMPGGVAVVQKVNLADDDDDSAAITVTRVVIDSAGDTPAADIDQIDILDGAGNTVGTATVADWPVEVTISGYTIADDGSDTLQVQVHVAASVAAESTLQLSTTVYNTEGTVVAWEWSGTALDTAPEAITLNHAPVADAGPDQIIDEGTVVTLDGSGSSDADAGDTLTYAWEQTAGVAVTLTGANTVSPTFTALEVDADTDLTFQLTVDDGNGGTDTDTVVVTVQNIPCTAAPVAPSGLTASVVSQTEIDLSWNDNSDTETGFHIYRLETVAASWRDLTPIASVAADTTTYSDTSLDCGTLYHYWVTAYNTCGESDATEIASVPTQPCGDFCWDTGTAPIHAQGSGTDDIGAFGVASDATDCYDANDVPHPPFALAPMTALWFVMNPTCSDADKYTHDIQAPVVCGVAKTWSMKVQDDGTATQVTISWDLSAITFGGCLTSLTLTDEVSGTVTDMRTQTQYTYTKAADPETRNFTIQVTCGSGPVCATANAGPDQDVHVGTTVQLDGSGSQNATTYRWEFVSVPAGSSAALSNADIANPTFVADLCGDYVTRLWAGRAGCWDSDTVTITAGNQAPVANAGADQTIQVPDDNEDNVPDQATTVHLAGSGSDLDSDPITSWHWEWVSWPGASAPALSDSQVANPTFVAPVYGNYVLRLQVDDGKPCNTWSAWDQVTIKIVPKPKFIFFDDMENGINGWQGNGQWGLQADPSCCSNDMPSDSHAWCYGENGSYFRSGTLVSQAIDVTGLTSVDLSFWYCFTLASSRYRAYVSTEVSFGGSWTKVWPGATASGSWKQIGPTTIQVPDSATTMRVRFNFESTAGKGCYCIDDVMVSPGTPIAQYTIAVSANPAAGGTATGGGTYNQGVGVTVSATPNPGYLFVNWTEGGAAVSTSASYTFNAAADRTLVANFQAGHVIAVSANPAGGGTVAGGGTYADGASVTVTANANSGYAFVNWTEGGTEVATTASYTLTAAADRTLVANFQQMPYMFFDDMEHGTNGWSATGQWGLQNAPGCCNGALPSPTHAWCYGEDGSYFRSGTLTSKAIAVSGVDSVDLSFWYCFTLASSRYRAYVSTEVSFGGPWKKVWPGAGATGNWKKVGPTSIAVPAGATTMRIRFNFESTGGRGCYCIDDVLVSPSGAAGALSYDGSNAVSDAPEFQVDSVQNTPNPVRDVHTTYFEVKGVGINLIEVQVFDQSGRSVFDSGWQPNGYEWHLETDSGETLANGIYLYVVTVMGYDGQTVVTQVKKLAVYR